MYKAIVSLENEVDHLKQKTNIITSNSDLNNYYTKSEIDDKLDDISGANLSNYVQFGENSTDEGIILAQSSGNHDKNILTASSIELTNDIGLTTNMDCSQINFTNQNDNTFRIGLYSTNDIAYFGNDGSIKFNVGNSTLTISEDDVTFNDSSMLVGSASGNYVINGENKGNINIATNNTGSINVTSGTGGINISGSGGSVNIASVSSKSILLLKVQR